MALERATVTPRRIEPWIGREMAGENDVERAFATTLGEVEHPSEVLRKRSEWHHRVGELYDHMVDRDAHLSGLELKRGDAVLNLPRRIEPGDASPLALEAAELSRWALGQIETLSINYRHQLESRGRGLAFEEIVWERLERGPYAGATVPVAMIDRPMHRFAFARKDHQLHVRRWQTTKRESRLAARGSLGGISGIPAPAGKFQISRSGTKDSPWGGKALLDQCYWYWFLKNHGWKWWAVSVEKWAQPTAKVTYPYNPADKKADRDLQEKALALAEAFQTEYAVAVPEGVLLELLEATRSGGFSYENFVDSCNRAMSLLWMGEINTSGLRPGVGAFASEKVSNEIRKEKVALDARDLGSAWSDGVLRWIADVNDGPGVASPKLIIETVEAEDRKLRQEAMGRVLDAGQPVPRRDFYLAHQVRMPEPGEAVVEGVAVAQQQLDEVELK